MQVGFSMRSAEATYTSCVLSITYDGGANIVDVIVDCIIFLFLLFLKSTTTINCLNLNGDGDEVLRSVFV